MQALEYAEALSWLGVAEALAKEPQAVDTLEEARRVWEKQAGPVNAQFVSMLLHLAVRGDEEEGARQSRALTSLQDRLRESGAVGSGTRC